MLPSYGKVWGMGHAALGQLFLGPVTVEEKIDGSYFAFGVYQSNADETPTLQFRSRAQQIIPDAGGMFQPGVEAVRELAEQLVPGWVYCGEYLAKPKHNALAYGRIPARHVILFDVRTGLETFLPYDAKAAEAARLGLDVVPRLHEGLVDLDVFRGFLDQESILGTVKIEGVVCKNYARFGPDGKVLMGKYVSEVFKETHRKNWKHENPGQKDVLTRLTLEHRTPARWRKAVERMRDEGRLLHAPQDIGPLLKEVQADIEVECAPQMKDDLWAWAWPTVRRGVVAGLPQWYKDLLLESQFDTTSAQS